MQNTEIFIPNKKNIYLGKIYKQVLYLVKKTLNKAEIIFNDKLSEDELLDIWHQFSQSLGELDRKDKDCLLKSVPSILKNCDEVVDMLELRQAFQTVNKLIALFDNFYYKHLKPIIEVYDKEFSQREFQGSYPKYYKYLDGEMFFVEYDEDIYFENDELYASRIGIITKILKFDEEFLDCNVEKFTYLDLFFDYPEQAQKGLLRNFVIYLPEIILCTEVKETQIVDDLRYFEIVDSALTKQKNLPKWYLNIRRTVKDFRKLYFIISLMIVLLVLSIVNYFLFAGKFTSLIVMWLVGGVIDYFACDYFAKKTYNKNHPNQKTNV